MIDDGIVYVSAWESGGDTERSNTTPTWAEALASADADKDGRISPAEAETLKIRGGSFRDADNDKDGFLDARDWEYVRARRTSTNSVVAIRPGGRGDVTDTHLLFRFRKSVPEESTHKRE